MVGRRDIHYALPFLLNLKERLIGRFQLTSDGLQIYLGAVEETFGDDIDYAMLIKVYGHPNTSAQTRYSQAPCLCARKVPIKGNPDPKHISTSYSERNNLNVRMHSRRMTRLTNAFSKKFENHMHAMALHFLYYNFVRIHQTLKVTPAMAAGVSKRLWEMKDVVDMIEACEAVGFRAAA